MFRHSISCLALLAVASFRVPGLATPVIDPIPDASILAGKSITIPITASSPDGHPLAFTVTSSTNLIAVEVHTNNPFWKMSVVQVAPSNAAGVYQTPFRGALATVTNIGDMTFLLLRDRAPRSVDAIAALTSSGFYNSNTIFHRIVLQPYFIIQGGDPNTNGMGGPVFRYDDELHPRSLYSSVGQLGLANSGPDTSGSQFFVTTAPQHSFDLRYTIFGQLLRGFNVLSNIVNTPTANSRPLADVIITRASMVTNLTDTAITLTAANVAGVSGIITVIAGDGTPGGRATNTFVATTVANSQNSPPILYPATVTNRVGAVNERITNYVAVLDLESNTPQWDVNFLDQSSLLNASNSTFNAASGRLVIIPATGYTGSIRLYTDVAPDIFFSTYDHRTYTFAIGDTTILALATNFTAQPLIPFTNQLLAMFTNGVPGSPPDNFTALINWGDNSTGSVAVVVGVGGQKEVRGSHTYTNSGNYPIYVTIRSALGAEAIVVSTAIVPPSLALTRSGTNNVLRWPASATDFQLQSHTNLASTGWSQVTNPALLADYETVVTNGGNGSNTFYRLQRR